MRCAFHQPDHDQARTQRYQPPLRAITELPEQPADHKQQHQDLNGNPSIGGWLLYTAEQTAACSLGHEHRVLP
jgi:hypothetical protein